MSLRVLPLTLLALLTSAVLPAADKGIILFQYLRTPKILENLATIEALPFDGICIDAPASWLWMQPGNPMDQEGQLWQDWLAPLDGKLVKMRRNWFMLQTDRPADFYDDWSGVIANARTIATAVKRLGCEGLLFDNEEYKGKIWNYPGTVSHADLYDAAAYQAQARKRGREIMQAILSVWPEARVAFAHGPYLSVPARPDWLIAQQAGAPDAYEMLGPFIAGFAEAATRPGQIVDGGELYNYRGPKVYQDSHRWRRETITSPGIVPDWIIPELRERWRDRVSIGFMLFDQSWSGLSMNPTIMRAQVEIALCAADDVVWYYTDVQDYAVAGKVDRIWLDAVRDGRGAALRK